MSNDVGQNSIRLLYYRYKDSLYYHLMVICFVIFVALILFFQIVIPKVQDWFSIRNEIIATQKRIDTINQNINFMNNLDKQQLKNQLAVATSAVPFEKDFGAILDALTDASLRAGVSLGDFSFQVGNIASASGQKQAIPQNDLSTVELKVSVGGNVDGVNSFLKQINAKLPLAEVVTLDGDGSSTVISLLFYQKDFPNIIFKDDQPLVALSDKYTTLLREMATWQVTNSEEPQATDSAISVPLF